MSVAGRNATYGPSAKLRPAFAAEAGTEQAAAEGEGGEDEGEAPPASRTRVEQIATDEFLVAITTQLESVGAAALPARELHAAALCETRAAERKKQAAVLQGRIDALHAKGRRLPL